MLIEDARRNGQHLRATWHPEKRQFVLSTWSSDVCTGAARLAAEDVAELTGLLVDGLADAPAPPAAAGLVDRLRWLVRGTAPGGTASAATNSGRRAAPVRPLRRRSA